MKESLIECLLNSLKRVSTFDRALSGIPLPHTPVLSGALLSMFIDKLFLVLMNCSLKVATTHSEALPNDSVAAAILIALIVIISNRI